MRIWFLSNQKSLQYAATVSACFAVISSGINLGWTSPYLKTLQDLSSKEATSWCAVMPLIGAPPGAFLSAYFSDKIGRKPTILAMSPFIFFSFLTMAFTESVLSYSICRFVIGAVEGGLYTVLPIYLAEIAEPEVRGLLTSTIAVAGIMGTLFINLIGPLCTIQLSSLISSVVPLMHFLSFVWMPESPYYYIKKLKFEQARASLRILRQKRDIEDELVSLIAAVGRQELGANTKLSSLYKVGSYRRGVLIFVILNVTNKFSGKNPFLFYTSDIFEEMGGALSPDTLVVMFTALELVSTIVAIAIIDKYGRRKLMLTSSIGCCLLLSIEGIFFYIKSTSPRSVEPFLWISITSLLLYNIIFSLGLAFGPVLLLGELFPTTIKSKALGLADTFSVTMGTAASQIFFYTGETYGRHVPFFIFSVSCLIGSMLIHKFLIETKGKTLEQIQLELIGR